MVAGLRAVGRDDLVERVLQARRGEHQHVPSVGGAAPAGAAERRPSRPAGTARRAAAIRIASIGVSSSVRRYAPIEYNAFARPRSRLCSRGRFDRSSEERPHADQRAQPAQGQGRRGRPRAPPPRTCGSTSGGTVVTAAITNEAVDELQLKVGDEAYAVVKASDVMVGKD